MGSIHSNSLPQLNHGGSAPESNITLYSIVYHHGKEGKRCQGTVAIRRGENIFKKLEMQGVDGRIVRGHHRFMLIDECGRLLLNPAWSLHWKTRTEIIWRSLDRTEAREKTIKLLRHGALKMGEVPSTLTLGTHYVCTVPQSRLDLFISNQPVPVSVLNGVTQKRQIFYVRPSEDLHALKQALRMPHVGASPNQPLFFTQEFEQIHRDRLICQLICGNKRQECIPEWHKGVTKVPAIRKLFLPAANQCCDIKDFGLHNGKITIPLALTIKVSNDNDGFEDPSYSPVPESPTLLRNQIATFLEEADLRVFQIPTVAWHSPYHPDSNDGGESLSNYDFLLSQYHLSLKHKVTVVLESEDFGLGLSSAPIPQSPASTKALTVQSSSRGNEISSSPVRTQSHLPVKIIVGIILEYLLDDILAPVEYWQLISIESARTVVTLHDCDIESNTGTSTHDPYVGDYTSYTIKSTLELNADAWNQSSGSTSYYSISFAPVHDDPYLQLQSQMKNIEKIDDKVCDDPQQEQKEAETSTNRTTPTSRPKFANARATFVFDSQPLTLPGPIASVETSPNWREMLFKASISDEAALAHQLLTTSWQFCISCQDRIPDHLGLFPKG